MIEDAEHEAAPTTAAKEHRVCAAFDRHVRVRCHDRRRLQSPAVTRAFASVIRTSSLGAQSEMSPPAEVMLEPGVDTQAVGITRGVD